MDSTVTSDVSMAVIAAMRQGTGALSDPTQDMSVAEAADYLGMSRTTLWRWCCEGKIKCIRRGKKFFIKAGEIQKMKGAA